MYRELDINDLKDMLNFIKIIDIRNRSDYKKGHLLGAINIPLDKLIMDEQKYLTKDEVYYIVCKYGRQSALLCEYLSSLGYLVVNCLGGMENWKGELVK
ncbi:MAG: rhodanese-like domain-containing protein [Bacilli bacterium]|nr:rhodanese-like domain-containing protein [Bacilli bacterium]